jgi:hypothetical protein
VRGFEVGREDCHELLVEGVLHEECHNRREKVRVRDGEDGGDEMELGWKELGRFGKDGKRRDLIGKVR